jgi:hypothetical protein
MAAVHANTVSTYLCLAERKALSLVRHVSLVQVVAAHLVLVLHEQLTVCDALAIPGDTHTRTALQQQTQHELRQEEEQYWAII